jgi:hypothetical protein
MQHTTEVERLKAAVQGAGGAEQAVKAGSAALKAVLQSAQVTAVYYFNDLNSLTVPQIKKAQRLEQAFQQVLDNPEAAQVLQHSALRPLAELAAS